GWRGGSATWSIAVEIPIPTGRLPERCSARCTGRTPFRRAGERECSPPSSTKEDLGRSVTTLGSCFNWLRQPGRLPPRRAEACLRLPSRCGASDARPAVATATPQRGDHALPEPAHVDGFLR